MLSRSLEAKFLTHIKGVAAQKADEARIVSKIMLRKGINRNRKCAPNRRIVATILTGILWPRDRG